MEEENNTPFRSRVAMIAAIGQNRELGKDNQLLWHLQEDMQFFKEQTSHHYVAMGRKSFESIPKKYRPLPNRVNLIISRDPDYMFEECYTFTNIKEAHDFASENGEPLIYIIGGGEIYKLALELNMVDEMYLTHVEASFPDAQVFFPAFDTTQWEKTSIKKVLADSQNEFSFEIFHYIKKGN